MRSVAEHRAAVLALVTALPAEDVPLRQAHRRALASDVVVDVDLPRWDSSAVDGYAVRRKDVRGASAAVPVSLEVLGDLPAGAGREPVLEPGTTVRIMTGAPVPRTADAVVPVEDTDGGTTVVQVRTAPEPRAHVRPAGGDVRTGEVLLTAGTELGPTELAALAALGRGTVRVGARPRVAVVSTGSELVPAGHDLLPGQVPDTNGPLLAAAVAEAGGVPVEVDVVPDDPTRLRAVLDRLDRPDAHVDLVVTTGGASVGAYDVVKEVLAPLGVTFLPVAVQPGKPQGLGRLPGGTPVLCLPGNPVSVHVCWELFVRPAVLRLRGAPDRPRPRSTAVAAAGWRTPPGREQYLPVVLGAGPGGTLVARPAARGGSGSHLVASLARAEALAVVPAEVSEVEPGDRLTVLRTDG